MPTDRASIIDRLREKLLGSAADSGGWPYYARRNVSRIEPTAWALIGIAGISRDDSSLETLVAPHVRFLSTLHGAHDLLLDYPEAPPNLTANGLAACALTRLFPTGNVPLLTRLRDGIVSLKGVSVDSVSGTQDNRLQAWPWIPDTFSWAEPTGWCLLALKKARGGAPAAAAARIAEADRLLLNRSCATGGWNYGNASALDQDLHPYVPTTALALIALQDRKTDPVVQRSLAYLVGARWSESSAAALALTAICLRIYDRLSEAADVEERLAADIARAERIGNLQSLAMALFALSADQHHAEAFRV